MHMTTTLVILLAAIGGYIYMMDTPSPPSPKSISSEIAKRSQRPTVVGKDVWISTMSGGGWRAQAGALGLAKALHEMNVLPGLDFMSSVSGGSWFNTQYAFSKKLYDSVNTPGKLPSQTYNEWLKSFTEELKEGTSKESAGMETVSAVIQKFAPTLESCLQAIVYSDYNWENLVSGMFNFYTPGLAEKDATPSNREGNPYGDLLVCMVAPTDGMQLADNVVYLNYKSKEDVQIKENILPIARHIPADPQEEADWFSPLYSLEDIDTKETVTSSGIFSIWNSYSKTNYKTLYAPPPSVGKVAAMSSAAIGALDWYGLLGDTVGSLLRTAVLDSGFTDMAVCTSSSKSCQFPSSKFVDAAYADNSGIASSIAFAQRKHGIVTPIKLVAMDANECPSPPCSLTYDWGDLFQNSTGAYLQGAPFGIKYDTVSNHIFQSPESEDGGNEFFGVGNISYSKGTFVTVENKAFGVKKGSTVQVLVVHINSPLATCLSANTMEAFGEYGQVADDVYESLTKKKPELLKSLFS